MKGRSRTPRNTIAMMILIMLVGFLLNIEVLLPFKDEHFVERGWVKGIFIYENDMRRELSLLQQGEMLGLLNNSICLSQTNAALLDDEKLDWGFEKIIIERFAKGEIELIPNGFTDGKMVFIVKGRDEQTCVLKANQQELKQILSR